MEDKKNIKIQNLKTFIIVGLILGLLITAFCLFSNYVSTKTGKAADRSNSAIEFYQLNPENVEFTEEYKDCDIYKIEINDDIYWGACDMTRNKIVKGYDTSVLIESSGTEKLYANKDKTIYTLYNNGEFICSVFLHKQDLKNAIKDLR